MFTLTVRDTSQFSHRLKSHLLVQCCKVLAFRTTWWANPLQYRMRDLATSTYSVISCTVVNDVCQWDSNNKSIFADLRLKHFIDLFIEYLMKNLENYRKTENSFNRNYLCKPQLSSGKFSQNVTHKFLKSDGKILLIL